MNHLSPIVEGSVSAPVLKLDVPLSFWGGVDHLTGIIIDQTHPQQGECIASRILVVPMIRGSGGTPGTIASLMKIGLGPCAIVLGYPEMNALTGVLVGKRLYGTSCPIYLADDETLESFRSDWIVNISPNGNWKRTLRG